MEGTEILKKVLTDSRFWLALWAGAQILLRRIGLDDELMNWANAFVALLAGIVFSASVASHAGAVSAMRTYDALADADEDAEGTEDDAPEDDEA